MKTVAMTSAIEQAKLKIKESIVTSDTLIDAQELADALNIDRAAVDKAYNELIKEGVVHEETYFLWKNPVMRQHLIDAIAEKKTHKTLGELREALGIE